MPSLNSTFYSTSGTGRLIFGDRPSPVVSYNFVLEVVDFSGGGFLFDLNEDDACQADELFQVCLDIGEKYYTLVIGRYEGNSLPVVVLGFTTKLDQVS